MAARRIPDPKAGGSNPSQVTRTPPGVAQLVEQWTVKRVAQRSIGRQFKSASPDVVRPSIFYFGWGLGAEQVPRARAGPPSYGHITAKTPDPIRTPKLSAVELDQYYGGGPRGNLECRMATSRRVFCFPFDFSCCAPGGRPGSRLGGRAVQGASFRY